MSKYFKNYIGGWAALFVIFNIATFVSPNEVAGMTKFGGAFWAGYIFIVLAFLGQLGVSYFAFQAKNQQKFFYKIPLIRISWTGLILTLVAGVLCMVIPDLPNWVGIIVCFAILGFNAISLIKANVAANLVSEVDETVNAKTSFIKTMTADAESLLLRAKSEDVKAACKKVYEAARYSDPMSSEQLVSIESQIATKFSEFTSALAHDDLALIKSVAEDMIALIDDRNKKCKASK